MKRKTPKKNEKMVYEGMTKIIESKTENFGLGVGTQHGGCTYLKTR